MTNLKENVPWWVKIGAKIILARLPIPYRWWKRVGLFEHGDMNQSQQAWETFLEHARTADVVDWESAKIRFKIRGDEYTVLEIGPGDSLFTAIIAKSLGASRTWLVDVGSFATMALQPYAEFVDYLRSQGLSAPLMVHSESLIDLLKECRAEFLGGGVSSLAHLPSKSVDYCFSNAVLEHIPKADFAQFTLDLYRIMKPEGVSVHRIDLRDHLESGLNNLRFTEAIWEGPLFRKSGFYTNRMRFSELVELFGRAEFACRFPRVLRWDVLPIPRAKLDEAFRYLADDDLLIKGFDVVLTRR